MAGCSVTLGGGIEMADLTSWTGLRAAVVDIAAAQGLDILGDPEAMRKFLNAPDNRAFRTTLERV